MKTFNSISALAFILFFSFYGVSQELPSQKSEKHQHIDGTNIFMVPPPSFTLSKNFKGFQNPDDPTSMIMVMEIPGPYSEISKGFNKEMMQTRGMDLQSKKQIKVANWEGQLIALDQPANGMLFSKHILIFGDENTSTLINGIFVKDSTEMGSKIKASVLSTFLDTSLESNPREALDYTLDETAGNLKFNSVIGNGMLFNRDLKTPTESPDGASLINDKSFAKVAIKDKKTFCITRVSQLPGNFEVISDIEIKEVEIDDLQGFELYARKMDDPSDEMYQLILFQDDGGYFIFIGNYRSGHEGAITDIKNVVNTFRRKK